MYQFLGGGERGTTQKEIDTFNSHLSVKSTRIKVKHLRRKLQGQIILLEYFNKYLRKKLY